MLKMLQSLEWIFIVFQSAGQDLYRLESCLKVLMKLEYNIIIIFSIY